MKANSNKQGDCLATLRLSLDYSPKTLSEVNRLAPWSLGPLLQGFLMEAIDSAYAELLHASRLNPYSQYCVAEGNKLVWVINALSQEATEKIVAPINTIESVYLKKHDLTLPIIERTEQRVSSTDLTALIHSSAAKRHKLCFLTPSSFKSSGDYQSMPNLRLIFQNLIMHYNQVYEGNNEVDPETIDYIEKHVRALSYKLSSRSYQIAGSRIPAFVGEITVGVNGPQPLTGFVHMLCRFAEYSGIGIKTAMGMGGVLSATPQGSSSNPFCHSKSAGHGFA